MTFIFWLDKFKNGSAYFARNIAAQNQLDSILNILHLLTIYYYFVKNMLKFIENINLYKNQNNFTDLINQINLNRNYMRPKKQNYKINKFLFDNYLMFKLKKFIYNKRIYHFTSE